MKKRILSLLLAVLLLLPLMPVVSAATSGTCGDGVTWSLNNGTLTISGEGPMNDYYNVESIPWYGMRESIKSIEVEAGVTHIGAYAFTNCLSTQHVVLRMTCLTSIGPGAFMSCGVSSGCTFETGMNLSMTTIGSEAFFGCNTNTEIYLPTKIVAINESAFLNCNKLPAVSIPATVKKIESRAFSGCTSLRSISFAGVPETISYGAFEGAPANAEVTFNGTKAQWDALSAGRDMTTEELLFGKGNTTHTIRFLVDTPVEPPVEPITLTLTETAGSDGAVLVNAAGPGLHATLKAPIGAKVTNYSLRIYPLNSGTPIATVNDDHTGTISQNPTTVGFTIWKTPTGNKITYSSYSLTLGETYRYDLTATVNGTVYTTAMGRFRLPAPEVKTYTVTFLNVINMTSSTKTVTNGQPYGTLPTPSSVSGYTFEGWYADSALTQRVTKDTIVNLTKDQTLFANMVRVQEQTVSLTLANKTGLSGVETVSPYSGRFESVLTAPAGSKITQYAFNIYTTGGSFLGSHKESCNVTTNGDVYRPNVTLAVTGGTVADGRTLKWGDVTLTAGTTYMYEFTATVDGKTYTTERSRFCISASSSSSTGFTDVKSSAYYADAVKWAVSKGITNGIGGGKFGPSQACTREQIVTFLWNDAGKPEPSSIATFGDMPKNETYQKAISWAAENNITSGYAGNIFRPGKTCNRAEAVTFIWRAHSSPEPKSIANFTDMPDIPDFQKAISWAYENEILAGDGKGHCLPNGKCERAHIVSMLYRAKDL